MNHLVKQLEKMDLQVELFPLLLTVQSDIIKQAHELVPDRKCNRAAKDLGKNQTHNVNIIPLNGLQAIRFLLSKWIC